MFSQDKYFRFANNKDETSYEESNTVKPESIKLEIPKDKRLSKNDGKRKEFSSPKLTLIYKGDDEVLKERGRLRLEFEKPLRNIKNL
jgi:hypothetical protein